MCFHVKLIGTVLLALLTLWVSACAGGRRVNREVTPAHALLDESSLQSERQALAARLTGGSPYLKAHMHNGYVYVLSESKIDTEQRWVEGTGQLLGLNREIRASGLLSFPLDSVALFETNRIQNTGSVAALALITGASIGVTVACAMNPKACFGSCPTFYVRDNGDLQLRAEGFSSSIAPSLEARDVDALGLVEHGGREVRIQMRNEALETHVIRYVNILAVPVSEGGRVFREVGGGFRQVAHLRDPVSCNAEEGDCRRLVRQADGRERFSSADSVDLAARETIELEFDVSGTPSLGLVIGARQTLLTTYLLYQTMAYMGRDAGRWFARIERGDRRVQGTGLGGILGGIEVSVLDNAGRWIPVGEVFEHGPLATDWHLLTLPEIPSATTRVRLRLTRGNWRLDYVGVAELGPRIDPLRIPPSRVYRGTEPSTEAHGTLTDSLQVLATLPGDIYDLEYRLPPGSASYEIFLESRGYYLEWIRQEWLADEDPVRLSKMLLFPGRTLRELAPEYKKVEPGMEKAFWSSRYAAY